MELFRRACGAGSQYVDGEWIAPPDSAKPDPAGASYGELFDIPIEVLDVRADISAVPNIERAMVRLELVVVNRDGGARDKATLRMPLPQSATVCGFELELDSGTMARAATVGKKQAAAVAYKEKEKGRAVASAKKVQGNVYETEVYPLPPGEERRIALSFTCMIVHDTHAHGEDLERAPTDGHSSDEEDAHGYGKMYSATATGGGVGGGADEHAWHVTLPISLPPLSGPLQPDGSVRRRSVTVSVETQPANLEMDLMIGGDTARHDYLEKEGMRYSTDLDGHALSDITLSSAHDHAAGLYVDPAAAGGGVLLARGEGVLSSTTHFAAFCPRETLDRLLIDDPALSEPSPGAAAGRPRSLSRSSSSGRRAPVHIGLIFDTSRSRAGRDTKPALKLLHAIENMHSMRGQEVRFSLFGISTEVERHCSDVSLTFAAATIESLNYDGGTDLSLLAHILEEASAKPGAGTLGTGSGGEAMFLGRRHRTLSCVSSVSSYVLFTDGNDNLPGQRVPDFGANSTPIYCPLGKDADAAVLGALAYSTGGCALPLDDANLPAIIAGVGDATVVCGVRLDPAEDVDEAEFNEIFQTEMELETVPDCRLLDVRWPIGAQGMLVTGTLPDETSTLPVVSTSEMIESISITLRRGEATKTVTLPLRPAGSSLTVGGGLARLIAVTHGQQLCTQAQLVNQDPDFIGQYCEEVAKKYEFVGDFTTLLMLHEAAQFSENEVPCPADHPAHAEYVRLEALKEVGREEAVAKEQKRLENELRGAAGLADRYKQYHKTFEQKLQDAAKLKQRQELDQARRQAYQQRGDQQRGGGGGGGGYQRFLNGGGSGAETVGEMRSARRSAPMGSVAAMRPGASAMMAAPRSLLEEEIADAEMSYDFEDDEDTEAELYSLQAENGGALDMAEMAPMMAMSAAPQGGALDMEEMATCAALAPPRSMARSSSEHELEELEATMGAEPPPPSPSMARSAPPLPPPGAPQPGLPPPGSAEEQSAEEQEVAELEARMFGRDVPPPKQKVAPEAAEEAFLAPIRSALATSPQLAYDVYLELAKEHGASPSFYCFAADVFRRSVTTPLSVAQRCIMNVVESKAGAASAQACRVVGYQLLALGASGRSGYEQVLQNAIEIFKLVEQLAPAEPHSKIGKCCPCSRCTCCWLVAYG